MSIGLNTSPVPLVLNIFFLFEVWGIHFANLIDFLAHGNLWTDC